MPRKAQMNANYRRNERLLEDGEIDIPGSGEGVSKEYVDTADASTLADAKAYTDDEIADIDIPEYTAGTGIAINNGVISNTAPNQVPPIATGDAGKVLTVNANEDGVEFAPVPKELPVIASGDAGKVLKVNTGETGVEWGNAGGTEYTAGNGISIVNGVITNTQPNVDELPQIVSGDAGKVLKVDSVGTGVEWSEINEVPTPTSGTDDGKVLTAIGLGAFGWVTPSGGGVTKTNISASTIYQEGDILIIRRAVISSISDAVSGIFECSSIDPMIGATFDSIGPITAGNIVQVSLHFEESDITSISGYLIR